MFNVTGGEVLIILVIALVVLGPEKLPDMIRKVGRVYGELRRMANGFQQELRNTLDEPTRDLRDTVNQARQGFTEAVVESGLPEPTAAPELAQTGAGEPVPGPGPEAPPLAGATLPPPAGAPLARPAIDLPGSAWPPVPPPPPPSAAPASWAAPPPESRTEPGS